MLLAKAEPMTPTAALTPGPISPAESRTCPIRSRARPRRFWNPSNPGILKFSLTVWTNSFTLEAAAATKSEIRWHTRLKTSPFFAASSIPTSQSPKEAVTSRIPPLRVPRPPSRGLKVLNTAENPCRMMSRTANRPLNVLPILSAVSSEMISLCVNLFSPSIKP